MRNVYLALLVALAGVVATFAFQNRELVTVSLFSSGLTLRLWALILAVYGVGMLSGAFVLALVRGWIQRARTPR